MDRGPAGLKYGLVSAAAVRMTKPIGSDLSVTPVHTGGCHLLSGLPWRHHISCMHMPTLNDTTPTPDTTYYNEIRLRYPGCSAAPNSTDEMLPGVVLPAVVRAAAVLLVCDTVRSPPQRFG